MSTIELVQPHHRSTSMPHVLKRVGVKYVDAFTETPLTGNPAGVVPHAEGLTDKQMHLIAREVSASETAFILPSTTASADLRIRWFTPQTEVPLCGHATIAAFHVLAEEGLYGMKEPGTYEFKLETQSGILPVTVVKQLRGIDVLFGLNVPEFERAGQSKLDVMRILNITLDEFENRLPILRSDYLFVPIRRLHTIFSLKPNFFAMSRFLDNRRLQGMCVFTTETIDQHSSIHSRFFAPTIGITEDPVTGAANGPLGVYLYQHDEVKATGDSVTITGEQGDVIGRKGRVTIRMGVRGKQVTDLKIGGRAVTVLTAEMRLP
ncbi:MAG: PhzF family phenazine biosynthesis protein [Bacteroidota bacterium]